MLDTPKSTDIEFEEGEPFHFEISHEIGHFWISYHPLDFNNQKLRTPQFQSLVKKIVNVMNNLNIQIRHFALDIIPDGGRAAACSVDEKREVLYLKLPIHLIKRHIVIPSRGIGEDYILYHELMHAKDILEHRFPSSGSFDFEKEPNKFLRGSVWNFSIEGRLEKHGKQHYSKRESIENEHQSFIERCEWSSKGEELVGLFTEEFFATLCEKTWGKELTSSKADALIEKLEDYFKARAR